MCSAAANSGWATYPADLGARPAGGARFLFKPETSRSDHDQARENWDSGQGRSPRSALLTGYAATCQ